MTDYRKRTVAQNKLIAAGVDDFLRERLSPDNPLKQIDLKNREKARQYYHLKKKELAERHKVQKGVIVPTPPSPVMGTSRAHSPP